MKQSVIALSLILVILTVCAPVTVQGALQHPGLKPVNTNNPTRDVYPALSEKHAVLDKMATAEASALDEKQAYGIFTSEGKPVSYQKMQEALSKRDVVFFGELHNNPIAHWLQLELTADLYEQQGDKLVLGAEMFEADDQLILDEYVNGTIREKNFKEEAKLWGNYETDYRPLVEYAREYQLTFIATNIPRRYASLVAQKGFDGLEDLTKEAKEYIAPLPIQYDPDLPGYKNMLKMKHMPGMKERAGNLPRAQAIKDATMAHFILENRGEDELFLHYNGTYHSNNKEGIVWYIQQHAEELQVGTIATVQQDQPDTLSDKHQDLADFILVVPQRMTKTH
ncbi:MAG TPA: ChaN family lipoprotein [Bacteroidales bacterium]|nr:ChaN family lipoprotein [Bacteroidales bacterium]